MLKLWYNRQNTKEKCLDFGAIVEEQKGLFYEISI